MKRILLQLGMLFCGLGCILALGSLFEGLLPAWAGVFLLVALGLTLRVLAVSYRRRAARQAGLRLTSAKHSLSAA